MKPKKKTSFASFTEQERKNMQEVVQLLARATEPKETKRGGGNKTPIETKHDS